MSDNNSTSLIDLSVTNKLEIPVIINYVRFRAENGFAILNVRLNTLSDRYDSKLVNKCREGLGLRKTKSLDDFFVTIGIFGENEDPREGEYVFVGEFSSHPKYGTQFKAEFYFQDSPKTQLSLKKFLMTLPYIKESISKLIIDKFGVEGTLDVLNNNPKKLLKVKWITETKLPFIIEAWKKRKHLKEIYEWFLDRGVSISRVEAIYLKWGEKSISVISDNPYALTELRGVGFIEADQVANRIDPNCSLSKRMVACIQYVISQDAKSNGNLCSLVSYVKVEAGDILSKCDKMLKKNNPASYYSTRVNSILLNNLDKFEIIKNINTGNVYVYDRRVWEKEQEISSILYKRSKDIFGCESVSDDEIKEAEKDVEELLGFPVKLDECQKRGVISAFSSKITVVTGGGGTGKSTICRCICYLAHKKKKTVRLMSPTGKAAQVLSEKTDREANTIHRSLKFAPGHDLPDDFVTEDILIVDETSMSGIDTFYAIMKATEGSAKTNIVFVGDANQLPSVSPGSFLSDLINSGCANVVKLEQIHRQSENSFISLIANKISKGEVCKEIPSNADDIRMIAVSSSKPEELIGKVFDDFINTNVPLENIQFMAPMYKGDWGVNRVNAILQQKVSEINETQHNFVELQFKEKMFVGDRVIQTENNYNMGVFNGDMGYIIDCGKKPKDPYKNNNAETFIKVDYGNNLRIEYFGEEINQVRLAWCITVHKFQGSQSPHIVFIMHNEANIMMYRELVYTAFTRAEKMLTIIGHASILPTVSDRSLLRKRNTHLDVFIRERRENKSIIKILSEVKRNEIEKQKVNTA